ncbi:J domain-containing protein [soil metagenome]
MSVKYQDYYATLGVSRTASGEEIQKAYRALARKLHPDVNKEAGSDARFKQVNEAYEVLKDPQKRKLFDQLGENWKAGQDIGGGAGGGARGRPRGGRAGRSGQSAQESADFSNFGGFGAGGMGGGNSGFSDFFDTIFGQGGFGAGAGGGAAGGRSAQGRGGAAGGEEEDPFQRGYRAAASAPPKGRDVETAVTIALIDAHRGALRRFSLKTQDGSAPERTIEVKIPAGTLDGATLRIAGQGEEGQGGRGALLVRVNVVPDARFRFDLSAAGSRSADLVTTAVLAPWEAALGAKVEVPTLSGSVTMNIPAGTSSGQRLRLRGQGFAQRVEGKSEPAAGDLYVEVQIAVPKTLSARERELMEELAKVSEFKPRG